MAEAVLIVRHDKSLHQWISRSRRSRKIFRQRKALALHVHHVHTRPVSSRLEIGVLPGRAAHTAVMSAPSLQYGLQHRVVQGYSGPGRCRPAPHSPAGYGAGKSMTSPEPPPCPGSGRIAPAARHRRTPAAASGRGCGSRIPTFAAAQVIQHTLALAVHDDAHVPDAGVDHVGEHKVHHPIVAAEGHGAVDAVLDQLPSPFAFS